ncbi:hypothetical protein [Salinibacterium sp.]|uniref:hypothetical protein n=1 Tax=Salinibacterium sp. TaxID=1915057 RepID=UPI00286B3D76|nr:hypothetical protein [Salinibacterium sp.]
MVRIMLSVVIAFAATALGYVALWNGGAVLLRDASNGGGADLSLVALLMAGGGLVLLATAMLSLALSPVGVITVGAIHLTVGLLSVLIPSSPFIPLFAQGFGADSAIGYGLLFSVSTGIGLLAGIIFLVTGLAALTRRAQKPGALARAASVIVAIVAGAMGILLAFIGGGSVHTTLILEARPGLEVTGVVLVLVGTILVGLAALTLRWSSLGAAVLGVLVTAMGIVGIAQPSQLASITQGVSRELTVAIQFACPNGNLALIGMLLLAAALGTLLRSRRWR